MVRGKGDPLPTPTGGGSEKEVTSPIQRQRGKYVNRYLLCPGNQARNLILFNPLNNPVKKVVASLFTDEKTEAQRY